MTSERQPLLPIAITTILVAGYTIALLLLVTTARRVAALAPQVAKTEAEAELVKKEPGADVQALQTKLAAERQRQAELLARFPGDLQAGVFDRVAREAEQSGISGFSYQRKSDYPETMQTGTYRVYRATIQGDGRQDNVLSFLDRLLQDTGPAILMENITVQPADSALRFSADILVYSLVVH